MADFTVRSDAVNVEQIMEQIRARIREKRGVDYTEEQIRELAAVKLQKFLDPRGVRSDLLEEFRKTQPPYTPPELPNFVFEGHTLYDSHRGAIRFIRKLLNPLLKLFFNPNILIQALNIQSKLNHQLAEREARLEASRRSTESLYYELIHNLVVETTRLGIEVKNLSMRIESMSSRLEFNERRARALESAVVYKPAAGDIVVTAGPAPAHEQRPQYDYGQGQQQSQQQSQPSLQQQQQPRPQGGAQEGGVPGEGPGQRSRRRRRRRGRRGGGSAAAVMQGSQASQSPPLQGSQGSQGSIGSQGSGSQGSQGSQDSEGSQDTGPDDFDEFEGDDRDRSIEANSFEQALASQSHATEAPAPQAAPEPAPEPAPSPVTPPPTEPDSQ